MNKYLYPIILIIILINLSLYVKASNKKIIYIDAGHGGIDPGAIYKNVKEEDINLNIVKYLKNEFINNNYTVYLTRDNDYDLSSSLYNRKKSDFDNRIKLINESNANLYLSIHLNSDINENTHGAQVFYVKNNKQIAETMQNELNRYYKQNKKTKIINNVYMYKKIKKKGILLELGFISNYMDRNNLQSDIYLKKLSKVIVNCIVKYNS